jgi:hypothetical protein
MFSRLQVHNARTNPRHYREGEGGTFLVALPPINRISHRGGPILNGWRADNPKKDWPPEVVDLVQQEIIKFNKDNPNAKVSLNPEHWRIDLSREFGKEFAVVDARLRRDLHPIQRLLENLSDLVLPRPSPDS